MAKLCTLHSNYHPLRMLFVERIRKVTVVHSFFLSFKGDKLKNEEECESLIIDCLVKLGRLDEAAKKLHKMIVPRPDHWLYMKKYIRCQVQRCQNFRERVRQQVERDRKNRQQQEATENGTGSSENSTNGDSERSRNSETEKDGESRDSGGIEVAGGEEKSDGVSTSDGQGQGEEEEKGKRGSDNERGTGGEGEGERGEVGDEEDEETVGGAKEITVR